MEFNTSEQLGKVLKSHGKEGEIIVSLNKELPETFLKMESIFIEIDGGVVPFFVDEIRMKSSETAILKLEDIDGIEQVNELIDCYWYLPKNVRDELNQVEYQPFGSLEGFTLIDQNDQKIGVVEGISDIPSNTLLQIRYKNRLIDVPANEETIYYIDKQKQILKNYIPEGLLE